jgi:hypothetical protein
MGNYTSRNGMQLSEDFATKSTIKRRMDMQQIRLKVMAVVTQQLHEPFEHYLLGSHEPHRDSLTRFNFALLDIIRTMFNLT